MTDDEFYKIMHLVDKKKLAEYRKKLKSFKIFNGMVVHDMRGPVTSMMIVLQEVSDMINSIKEASLTLE